MEQLEGRNPVLEALQSGLAINRISIAKGVRGRPIDQIVALCKQQKVNLQWVDRSLLDRISQTGGRHQGVIAEVASVGYASLDQVVESARQSGRDLLLVMLCGVEDPHNLGSVIRTAEAAGVHGVIIPRHRAAGVTAAVARASAGALVHMPVVRVTNLVDTVKQLKELGAFVVGADAAARQLAVECDLTGPLVLVLGGEGKGISRLLRDNCDCLVRFPMFGQVNSLNVSVSAALLIYEVVRQSQSK
ncbi:MAG: 23S rRNA (guanosine(2251)-2'-O)-methyltransferase RlmB [Bacillota bacterium]|jgi:23S rRNA (guanosine2251-2'-O)-methyltransferase